MCTLNELAIIATVVGPVLRFGLNPNASAQEWQQTAAPTNNWTDLACSADGLKLVATADGDGIYTSQDAGSTWAKTTAPAMDWRAVCASADGTIVVAAAYNFTYTTTNFGVTWNLPVYCGEPNTGIVCSADGTRLLDVSETLMHGGGAIHTSTNSGATWEMPVPSGYWVAVACSANGTEVVVAQRHNVICCSPLFISPDFGRSSLSGPADSWLALACSADGTKMFASAAQAFYRSENSGATWVAAPGAALASLACSADGTRLIGAGGLGYRSLTSGPIYTSLDSGVTWISNTAPALQWSAVASSADGCHLFAAAYGGGIYSWQVRPAPVLSMINRGKTFILSWLVTSMNFSPEESSNLAIWFELAVTPVLNYTNLHFEASLPPETGQKFYRLVRR